MKKLMMALLLCLACTCVVAAFSACGTSVAVEGITLGESAVTLEVGDEYVIQWDIYPAESSDKGVVFTSSNQNIITVNSDGSVYAAAEGEAYVTAVTNDGGFSVNCAFTVTEKSYTITYVADGVTVSTQRYVLSDARVEEPSPPEKAGYTASWESYSLGAESVTVNAVYVPIEYEAVFMDADGAVLYTAVYTVESELNEPPVPAREHYVGSWDYSGLAVGGMVIYPVYTPEQYSAVFIADGETVSTVFYSVESWYVQPPEVPQKSGYAGEWENFSLGYGGITVRAVYTAINYKATFMANGAVVSAVYFTVENDSVAAPDVPSVNGYTGEWESYAVICGDFTVNAVYTPVTYTITYLNCKGADNANNPSYTAESNFALSELACEHYNFLGWYSDGEKITSTVGLYRDLTLTAEWEAVQYKVVFCYGNHETYCTVYYTADNASVEVPAVPTEEGYTGEWEAYVLNYETVYVSPVYTMATYTATFVADGETVGIVEFTIENAVITAPTLTAKDGYTAAWEEFSVKYENFTVQAVYTPVTYYITYVDDMGADNCNPSTYTVENGVTFESLSAEHYTFSGWYSGGEKIDSTEGLCENITLTAAWEAVLYSVTFCYEDGTSYCVESYTVENKSITEPAVPSKVGYVGAWEVYSLDCENIAVLPVYVEDNAVEITVTFIAGTEIAGYVVYYGGVARSSVPVVPAKEGCTGEWESFTLGEEDLTVYALYTSENASEGLEYVEDSEGNLTVTGYTGESGGVTVPALYKNKTVTAVSADAFSGNALITELVLPSTITLLDGGVLAGMGGLQSLTLPFIGSSNGTASACLGYVFGTACYSGGTAVRQYYSSSDSSLYAAYYLPSGLTSVTVLGGEVFYGAFWGCGMLTEIIICGGVTVINDSALNGCSSLVSLTLPFVGARGSNRDYYTSLFGYIFGASSYSGGTSVKQYYSASKCETYCIPDALESVTITGKYICYGAFWGCGNITSVTIGADVTYIGQYAFEGCSSLISVVFSEGGSWTVNGQTAEVVGGENAYEKIVEYGKYSWEKA